jgi:hypothetical protein
MVKLQGATAAAELHQQQILQLLSQTTANK